MARPLVHRPDILAFAEIAAIDRAVTLAMERALPAGVTRPAFDLINRLALADEGSSPAGLAEAAGVTRGAMTSLLQRLERDGLIRVAGEAADGRRKRISLTHKGIQLHQACMMALKPMMEQVRDAIPADVFAEALPFLQGLRKAI
jgi:DNA-binding MarR family transcriptional regulator